MNRITKIIIVAVLSTHLCALLVLAYSKKSALTTFIKPITVNTYTYQPPKKIAKAQSAPVKKTMARKKPKPVQKRKTREMLSQLEKNLNKIKAPAPKVEKKVVAYANLLADRLQTHLHLPEEGHVKLKLCLNADGKVIGLDILETQSERNANYLKAEIPKLHLPHFSGDHMGKKQNTFTLTVCHDA